MTSYTIDIDIPKEIKILEKRRAELMAIHIATVNPGKKVQITYLLTEINYRITMLGVIYSHKLTSIVTVSRPTPGEITKIQTALTNLDKVIVQQQTFEQTIETVTTILEAADTVNTAVK